MFGFVYLWFHHLCSNSLVELYRRKANKVAHDMNIYLGTVIYMVNLQVFDLLSDCIATDFFKQSKTKYI